MKGIAPGLLLFIGGYAIGHGGQGADSPEMLLVVLAGAAFSFIGMIAYVMGLHE